MDTIRDMIATQRAELAEVLTGLPGPSWDEPTLCAGWRVREVVAHITMPFRFSGRRFALELAKSRGRSTRWPTGSRATRPRCRPRTWPGRSGPTPTSVEAAGRRVHRGAGS